MPLPVPAKFDDRGLRYLQELVIRVDSGLLRVSGTNDQLLITGSKEKLGLFSDNIDWLVESQATGIPHKRDHLHIEFYPGHSFLAEDALPLILIRQD